MSQIFLKIIPLTLAVLLIAVLTVADYGASLQPDASTAEDAQDTLLATWVETPQAVQQIAAAVAAVRSEMGTARSRNDDLGVFETLDILIRTPEILNDEAEEAVNNNLAMLDIRDAAGNIMTVDSPEFRSGVRHFEGLSLSGQSTMIENMINANITKMKQTQAKVFNR